MQGNLKKKPDIRFVGSARRSNLQMELYAQSPEKKRPWLPWPPESSLVQLTEWLFASAINFERMLISAYHPPAQLVAVSLYDHPIAKTMRGQD